MPERRCWVNRGLNDFHVSFVNQYPILRVLKKADAIKWLNETTGVVGDIKRCHRSLSTHWQKFSYL